MEKFPTRPDFKFLTSTQREATKSARKTVRFDGEKVVFNSQRRFPSLQLLINLFKKKQVKVETTNPSWKDSVDSKEEGKKAAFMLVFVYKFMNLFKRSEGRKGKNGKPKKGSMGEKSMDFSTTSTVDLSLNESSLKLLRTNSQKQTGIFYGSRFMKRHSTSPARLYGSKECPNELLEEIKKRNREFEMKRYQSAKYDFNFEDDFDCLEDDNDSVFSNGSYDEESWNPVPVL